MRPIHTPGLRSWNYFSYSQSPYHIWFQELGYPQLDITQFEDGEWCIIEYINAPLIPAECKYRTILAGMKNLEISFSFLERYLDEINPQSARFWQNLEKHERAQDAEYDTFEKNAEDRAHRASRFVIQNPDLMERIAKHGLDQMDVFKIAKHIPRYKL
jgi:uncharacterized coiled-coil protein SlyX